VRVVLALCHQYKVCMPGIVFNKVARVSLPGMRKCTAMQSSWL
jgi:hypothetical protein